MSDGGLIVTPPRLAPTSFNIADYGGVCDGVADDTAAFARCYALCTAEPSGGNIILPFGSTRITSTRLLDNSTNGSAPKPVFIVGQNEYPSILLWDPIVLTSDCIHYQGAGGAFYFGGGIQGVAIISANPLASGKAVRVKQCFNQQYSKLWTRGFRGGVTGRGFVIEGGDDPNDPSQHIDLANLMLQENCIGLEVGGVVGLTMRNVMVNQNTVAQSRITGGTIQWTDGLVQGGGVPGVQLSPGAGDLIVFNQTGCHYEVTGGADSIVATEAPGDAFSGSISVSNVDNSGDGTFLVADHYAVRLANISSNGSIVVAELVECGLTSIDCSAHPAEWDLDAFTVANATFINGGHISLGKLPSSPFLVPRSAAFALPIELASLTQTQRDLLTGVADGWTFLNSSARVPQSYVAGRVKPWVCLAPENALEIWPALMHHFTSFRGAWPGGWADQVGAVTFIPSGAPPCEADGKLFNGGPVWKLLLASSQMLDTGSGGATMFPMGAPGFYARVIARRTVPLGGSFGTILNMFDNAATLILGQFLDNATDSAFEGAFAAGRTNFGPPPALDNNVHKFELWLSPTHSRFTFDGVVIADSGVGVPLAQPIQRLSMGAFPGAGFFANVNIADLKIGPTEPTGDTAAALNELDYNLYGYG